MGNNVLLVDDEVIISMEIKATLTKSGYHVVGTAINGEEALKLAETKQPDLVLMDIRIKGDMDGIETASRIMEMWNIPVIYLSGNSDRATSERAEATKPAGILYKPVVTAQLLDLIGSIIPADSA